MDIFQLIGDFLHLMAAVMLNLKIMANRNVFARHLLIYRSLLQNSINVSCRFSHSLYRPPDGLENPVPIPHENFFHCLYCLYNSLNEIQKAILSQLRSGFRLLPPLLFVLRITFPRSNNP